MLKFLATHRRGLFLFGCFMLALSFVPYLTGCAASTFLTDLEEVIPTAITGITGILSIIAALTGNAELAVAVTAINAVASKVEAGLQNINGLIESYKSNPNDTLLENIEANIQTTISDIQPLLTAEGLPTAEATNIQNIAQAVYNQLVSLLSILPVLKGSTAGQTITATKPIAAAEFKAQIAAALQASKSTAKEKRTPETDRPRRKPGLFCA